MLDSNTTLVKVKFDRNFNGGVIIWNSNTTLVKVKLCGRLLEKDKDTNSNTTLVKVKSSEGDKNTIPANKFKYNSC